MKKRKPNPKSHNHVIRIDHKSTHGYQCRIPLRPVPTSKFFSDGKCGGKVKALAAAITYRNHMFDEHDIPLTANRSIRYTNSRNSTGVLGVGMQWVKKGNYQYFYYVVTWCPRPYRQRNRMFSAHKLGDAEAFRQAVAFRKQKEQEIHNM